MTRELCGRMRAVRQAVKRFKVARKPIVEALNDLGARRFVFRFGYNDENNDIPVI